MCAIFRSFLVVAVALTVAGYGHRPPTPRPLFPMTATWTRPSGTVEGPLAADAISVFVPRATAPSAPWTCRPAAQLARRRPAGRGAGGGLVAVRNEDARSGRWIRRRSDRWKAASGVRGPLPPSYIKRCGRRRRGRTRRIGSGDGPRWSAPEARATASPLGWGPWLFVGEADGSLRCRDLATGAVLWSYKMAHPLAAAPVVDDEGHVLLGTTDRRFVALDPRKKGHVRWQWKLGGDVQAPPTVSGPHVLFTNHEDVLYALRRGNGHLAWRASLPSRPLSSPILYGDGVLVACFEGRPGETFLIGFDPRAGGRGRRPEGTGRVRTPPLIVGDVIVMALRDRAVAALRLGLWAKSLTPGTPSHNIAFETRTALNQAVESRAQPYFTRSHVHAESLAIVALAAPRAFVACGGREKGSRGRARQHDCRRPRRRRGRRRQGIGIDRRQDQLRGDGARPGEDQGLGRPLLPEGAQDGLERKVVDVRTAASRTSSCTSERPHRHLSAAHGSGRARPAGLHVQAAHGGAAGQPASRSEQRRDAPQHPSPPGREQEFNIGPAAQGMESTKTFDKKEV